MNLRSDTENSLLTKTNWLEQSLAAIQTCKRRLDCRVLRDHFNIPGRRLTASAIRNYADFVLEKQSQFNKRWPKDESFKVNVESLTEEYWEALKKL